MKNIVITGSKRVGKSTIVNNILEQVDCQVGGFFTKATYEGDLHVGFAIVDQEGRREVFADRHGSGNRQFSDFQVRTEIFDDFGSDILERALEKADMIFMDEIGCMEQNALRFRCSVEACFDSPKPVLCVIQNADCSFVHKLLSRNDIKTCVLTPENREQTNWQIFEKLRMLGIVADE